VRALHAQIPNFANIYLIMENGMQDIIDRLTEIQAKIQHLQVRL